MGISAVLSAAGAVPVGVVNPFAGANAPAGWLLCYGQEVSRIQYPALFNTLSTTYGVGDGATTFNVPDLRGRTIAGVDNMGGTDAGRLDIANSSGTVTGSQYVTLTSGQSGLPAHTHANTASFSGTAASHTHIQDSHSHSVYDPSHAHQFTPRYGGYQGVGLEMNVPSWSTPYGLGYGYVEGNYASTSNYSTTVGNQNTSITPAGSVTVSNVNNTAANAASAHDNMPPTMVLNYIIKAMN
jgi:microcystin-dependent protein